MFVYFIPALYMALVASFLSLVIRRKALMQVDSFVSLKKWRYGDPSLVVPGVVESHRNPECHPSQNRL